MELRTTGFDRQRLPGDTSGSVAISTPNGLTATGSFSGFTTPCPPDLNMHVGDLDGVTQGNWKALVTVTVHDDNEAAVESASVTGTWTEAGNNPETSCTTAADGTCTLDSKNIGAGTPSTIFEVTDVTHASYTYESGDNHDEADGDDGTGTTLTVIQ